MSMSPERRAGAIFVGVGALILLAIVLTLVSSGSWSLRYTVLFGGAQGLAVGDRVQMSGVDIGQVDAILLATDGRSVRVKLKVSPEHRQKVQVDSTAYITSPTTLNVSGQKIVEIHNPSAPAPPMANDQVVQGMDSLLELKAWQLKGKVQEWGRSVSKASKGLGETARQLAQSASEAAKSAAQGAKEGFAQGKETLKKGATPAPGATPIGPTPAPETGRQSAPPIQDPSQPSQVTETVKRLTEFLGELGVKGKAGLAELLKKWEQIKKDVAPQLKEMTERGMDYLRQQIQSLMNEIQQQLDRMQREGADPPGAQATPKPEPVKI